MRGELLFGTGEGTGDLTDVGPVVVGPCVVGADVGERTEYE